MTVTSPERSLLRTEIALRFSVTYASEKDAKKANDKRPAACVTSTSHIPFPINNAQWSHRLLESPGAHSRVFWPPLPHCAMGEDGGEGQNDRSFSEHPAMNKCIVVDRARLLQEGH